MENAPQIKRDEQYPLLKVQGGGGDANQNCQSQTTVVAKGWSVTCVPKKTWYTRWPEYVSACWMLLILLAMSFLVFYALGTSAYRRQSLVLRRCNNSEPNNSSKVYYHHIVPRGTEISFKQYSNYLSYMATQYPSLNFHIYFLVDDLWKRQFGGSKFFKSLVPQMSRTLNSISNQNYKRQILDFQRKYKNVNISIMSLNLYMAQTPLKYKWKTIPKQYLLFYMRIYETWLSGGIGFNLVTFNNRFRLNKRLDHRVSAILKQHNDGIELDKYAEMLDSFDKAEQSEFFSIFFNFFNNILNETSLFNTKYLNEIKVLDDSPINRSHRIKRESRNEEEIKYISIDTDITNKVDNDRTMDINLNVTYDNKTKLTDNLTTAIYPIRTSINFTNPGISSRNASVEKSPKSIKKGESNREMPEILLFYEVFGNFDDNELVVLPKTDLNRESSIRNFLNQRKINTNYLTLSPEGDFVAASSPHHPFLYHIFSAGCNGLNPVFAIKELFWRHCSNFLINNPYCESIQLIYNIF